MKRILRLPLLVFSILLLACQDQIEDDIVPKAFTDIKLKADLIYIYNGNSEIGTRLDPLFNDSIKVAVDVTYSGASHGSISFIENEGWFYKPDAGFFGTDNFQYKVCYKDQCQSQDITLIIEQPLDANNCTGYLNGETVETKKDQPLEIRVFDNDLVCPFDGFGINSPQKGTFKMYSYAGGYKNNVYVYFPPAGFTGTDQFTYRIFTGNGTIQATCTINVVQ